MRTGGAVEIGLLVAVGALALLALALVFVAILAQRRLRRTLRVTRGATGNEFLLALREHGDDLDALETAVIDLQARVDDVERDLVICTNRVAMVHYDAFPDMGGKLSFSLAMLDERPTDRVSRARRQLRLGGGATCQPQAGVAAAHAYRGRRCRRRPGGCV